MDGGSVENAGAFFNLAKNLRRVVARAELAPTFCIVADLSRLKALLRQRLRRLHVTQLPLTSCQ